MDSEDDVATYATEIANSADSASSEDGSTFSGDLFDATTFRFLSMPQCMQIPVTMHSIYLSNRLRLQLADGLACTSRLVPGWLMRSIGDGPSLFPASLRFVAASALAFGR